MKNPHAIALGSIRSEKKTAAARANARWPQGIIEIRHNGSKWAGQSPDPIESLIERLQQHNLDSRWTRVTRVGNNRRYEGNFVDIAASFCIVVKVGSQADEKITSLWRANRRKHRIM